MANTFAAITTVTFTNSTTSTLDFTSIPQGYTDLMVLISARSTRAGVGDPLLMKINSSTTNRIYSTVEGRVATNNTVAFGDTTALFIGTLPGSTAGTSIFGSAKVYFANYSATQHKQSFADVVQENDTSNAYLTFSSNLWTDTSAITSLSFYWDTAGSNFAQYSTATLYGIKNS